MKKIHLHSLLAISLFILTPSVAAAATNQQIFNSAVVETFKKDAALRIDSRFDVKLNETRVSDKKSVSQFETVLRYMSRRRPNNGVRQDYEGRLVVEKMSVSGEALGMPFKLADPLAVEWKKIADTGYYRLKTNKLPEELSQLVGPDIAPFIGQWLRSTPTQIKEGATALGGSAVNLKDSPLSTETVDSTGLQDLQVVRIEKTERRKNGDLIYRFRMRVNPNAVTKYEKEGLANLQKSTRVDKAEAIKKFKTSVADMRRALTHTWFAATVNVTQKALERLEIQGWADWSSDDKAGKPTKIKANYAIGMSFLRDGNWEVVKPENSLDLNAVFSFVLAQMFKSSLPAVEEAAVSEAVPFSDPVAGLWLEYPAGWDSAENRLRFAAYPQPIDETMSDAQNIDSAWKFLRSYLVEGTLTVDGMKQVRETLASSFTLPTDGGIDIDGGRYTMTRRTSDASGWVTTDVIIAPNKATGQVVAFILEGPADMTPAEKSLKTQILDTFTLIGFLP
ncbi:MAG: hypothetical protein RDU25_02785 [Patescibacteria group bacterium]|nr:hypothetical protein [Patescibacteria group bacterium]